MMSGPQWKIYDRAGTYQAACKEGRAAACLVSFYGAGATIRAGHGVVVWREGQEAFPAEDGSDVVDRLIQQRTTEAARAAFDRIHGPGAAAALVARGQHSSGGDVR